jgi:thiol-disulfide isomerase/thioredoxin
MHFILFLLLIVTTFLGVFTSAWEYYYVDDNGDSGYGEPDYYADLGIERTATAREIKRKYRTLARELHPDKQKIYDSNTQNKFEKIQVAYEVLSNPEKRDAYDDTGLSTFTSRWDWIHALESRGKPVDGSKGFFKDLDLIIQFTPTTLKHFYNYQRDPYIVDFYAPWCSHCLDAAPAIRSLAISLDAESSKIKVGAVNCEHYGNICEEFGVHSYPTLKIFYVDENGNRREDNSDHHKKYEDILPWIKRITESKVQSLSRNNFQGNVLVTTSLYIISFTAGEWCPPCTRFRTSFRDAAYKLVDGTKDIAFGQVDCDQHKSFCSEFNVGHYPYLIMYPPSKDRSKDNFIDLNIDNVNNADVLSVLERIIPAILPSPVQQTLET